MRFVYLHEQYPKPLQSKSELFICVDPNLSDGLSIQFNDIKYWNLTSYYLGVCVDSIPLKQNKNVQQIKRCNQNNLHDHKRTAPNS